MNKPPNVRAGKIDTFLDTRPELVEQFERDAARVGLSCDAFLAMVKSHGVKTSRAGASRWRTKTRRFAGRHGKYSARHARLNAVILAIPADNLGPIEELPIVRAALDRLASRHGGGDGGGA